jgi:LacI family transcriptional regulator
MVMNDAQAALLLTALEEMGIEVPDQLAIVGAENTELLCQMSLVSLSSVEANYMEMGYQAAALLDRIMDGEAPPDEPLTIAPGPVVARQSTNLLAADSEYTTQALRFIWKHYREPISVDDVAANVSITRRRLQTVFREDLDRTILEEINQIRVETACRHLKAGDLKVHEIAALTGFSSSVHMHRAFSNHFGYGPKAYLEQGRPDHVPEIPSPVD